MIRSHEHPFEPGDEVFSTSIPSSLEERDALVASVLARLEELGFSPHPFFDRLILDEVITNAILHGNAGDPSRKVTLRLLRRGDTWGVEVADEGEGFDWRSKLVKIDDSPVSLKPSGRGIPLLVALGVGLHYVDPGNRVLVVRFPDLRLPG